MMKSRKIISTLLSAILLFSSISTDAVYANEEEPIDSTEQTAEVEEVNQVPDEEVLNGVTEPEENIEVLEETVEEVVHNEETTTEEPTNVGALNVEDQTTSKEETKEEVKEDVKTEEQQPEEKNEVTEEEPAQAEPAQDVQVKMPAQTMKASSAEMEVIVKFDEGIFPEDVSMMVRQFSSEQTKVIAQTLSNDTEVVDAIAVDISFYTYRNGKREKVDPVNPGGFTFNYYHIVRFKVKHIMLCTLKAMVQSLKL